MTNGSDVHDTGLVCIERVVGSHERCPEGRAKDTKKVVTVNRTDIGG